MCSVLTDSQEPDCQHLTEEDIATSLSGQSNESNDIDKDMVNFPTIKLSEVRDGSDKYMEWVENIDSREIQEHCPILRNLRSHVIIRHNSYFNQPKILEFFKSPVKRNKLDSMGSDSVCLVISGVVSSDDESVASTTMSHIPSLKSC